MKRRSVGPMRAAKVGYLLSSAAFCIIGILLITLPEFSASLLGVFCGILFLAFGGVKLLGYFSKDLYRLAFQYDLTFGILLMALGVGLLVHPEGLMTFLCTALGLFILADGLFKMQIAQDAKKFGLSAWYLIFAVALLASALGVVLMLRPSEGSRILMILLGVSLFIDGILNFCTVITAVKIIKHQRPEKIDICDFEERED